jgi:predicted hydrolase (HD superfamily)
MEIKLNEDEIREVLAEAIEKKLSHAIIDINPQSCWFEAAAMIEGDKITDIHEVKFCYQTKE